MKRNHPDIITRLKAHPGIADDATVGVVSSLGKGAEIVSKDDTLDILATLTTTDVDLDDEVLVAGGGDVSYLKRNTAIFADHNYDMMNYVGAMRSIYQYGDPENPKGWKMRFHVSDMPLGKACAKIVEFAGQIGISIGFKAIDFGPPTAEELELYGGTKKFSSIVRKWEAFEGSTTCLPCNVPCQGVSGSSVKTPIISVGKSVDMYNAVEELVTRGIIDRESASLLGMPISAKRKMHAVTTPTKTRKKLILMDNGLVMIKRS